MHRNGLRSIHTPWVRSLCLAHTHVRIALAHWHARDQLPWLVPNVRTGRRVLARLLRMIETI